MSAITGVGQYKITHPSHLVWRTLFAAAFILACLVLAGAQKPGSEFAVTGSGLKADEAKLIGPCPIIVKFTGYVTTNGPGTVKYTFTRSDGATGPAFTLDFKAAGTQQVSTAWTLGDAVALPTYEGWQALKVLSPNEVESSHETGRFVLKCALGAQVDVEKVQGSGEGARARREAAAIDPAGPTDFKKESQQSEKISSSNLEQTNPVKFPGRKGSPQAALTEVPQSSASVSEVGRIKTTKVNNVDTRIDPGNLHGATQVVDIRRRGPNLSNTSGNARDADVAAAGDNVYAVWADDTYGNSEILLAVSTDHGASFWPPVNLSNTPTHSRDPRVAASGDHVYVVWIEDAGSSIGMFTTSKDGADSFSGHDDRQD